MRQVGHDEVPLVANIRVQCSAGGANMGLEHGAYWRNGETRMSNMYLSILHSLGVEQESFADSTTTLSDSIFKRV